MNRTEAFGKPTSMTSAKEKAKKPNPFANRAMSDVEGDEMETPSATSKSPMGGEGMEKPPLGMAASPNSGGKATLDKAGFMTEEQKCDMCVHFNNNQCDKVEVDFGQFDPALTVCEKFFEEKGEGMGEEKAEGETMMEGSAPAAPPAIPAARSMRP